MRLIDADYADKLARDMFKGQIGITFYQSVHAVLEAVKPVDAVPVVHCGKCKNYHPENGADYRCDRPAGRFSQIAEDPNGFCSYGERKDEEK